MAKRDFLAIPDFSRDELEALLIQADLGVETAGSAIAAMQTQARDAGWTKAEQLK